MVHILIFIYIYIYTANDCSPSDEMKQQQFEQELQLEPSIGIIKPRIIKMSKGYLYDILIGISPRIRAQCVQDIRANYFNAKIYLPSKPKLRSHGHIIRETTAFIVDARALNDIEKYQIAQQIQEGYEHICSFQFNVCLYYYFLVFFK